MHWGRVTHICVGNLAIIGSDNGLLPARSQAIIWTNAWILLIGPLGPNFNEILFEIWTFSLKKMRSKVSSAKWWPFLSQPQCVKGLWQHHIVILLYSNTGARAHFADDFSITIQMWWEFHFALIQISKNPLLQIFAHATTAKLLHHVQIFVVSCWPGNELQRKEIFILYEFWMKNH